MLTHIQDLSSYVGQESGYYFIITKKSIVFSVTSDKRTQAKSLKKYLKHNFKGILNPSFTWNQSLLTVSTKKKKLSPEELEFCGIQIVDFLINESVIQVCQVSLTTEDLRPYRINNDIFILSKEAYLEEKAEAEAFYERSGDRIITYLKIICTLIGFGLIWFLVSQMGYIVYLISIGMVVVSYYIFEKNSGRPTKTDSLIIFLINISTIMIAEYLSMAYKFYKLFEKQISYSNILSMVMPYALSDSDILWTFIANIGIGAFVLIVVAFFFAKSAMEDQDKTYIAYPIIVDDFQEYK